MTGHMTRNSGNAIGWQASLHEVARWLHTRALELYASMHTSRVMIIHPVADDDGEIHLLVSKLKLLIATEI